jgi:hypothetical protein
MSDDILDGLTAELTRNEVLANRSWTMEATVLTNNNIDRSAINGTIAPIFACQTGQCVLRWRRKFNQDLPRSLQELIYCEDTHPDLFGYFVQGAPAQILDNGNGNVSYGVANGTPCKMVSVAWNDSVVGANVAKKMANCSNTVNTVIDIPAPDFIIVSIQPSLDPHLQWPAHLNLSDDDREIHIPIGLRTRPHEKNTP